jgi:dihydroorotate dehydrogenase
LMKGLVLKDPFMIASSHWTSSVQVFRQLALIKPSAITLKTTSEIKGEDGERGSGKREKRQLVDHSQHLFAAFTDGPPTLEFWDTTTTYRMTSEARKILPETILGLSVLEGENYQSICESLDMSMYGYVELNWKYTFRNLSSDGLAHVVNDLRNFHAAFSTHPTIIKLPREALPLLSDPQFQELLTQLRGTGSALLIANSKRLRVPPSRVSGVGPKELISGVVHGEYLFMETYDSIRTYVSCQKPGHIPTIIASGGITDIAGVVDVLAVGSDAVQLCTALDVRGPRLVHWLREQLSALCRDHGSYARFKDAIRGTEKSWYTAVTKAHELDLFGTQVVREVLSDSPRIQQLVAKTLAFECSDGVAPKIQRQPRFTRLFTLVASRGNVSSALIAQRCANRLHLELVLVENSAEFRTRLSQSHFSYDFVILPEGALKSIQKMKPAVPSRPTIRGPLLRSSVELVGIASTPLTEIERVYHFSGLSAKNAVSDLTKVIKPEVVELKGEDLLPLFRFWDAKSAILAKPPLSGLYPLLGQADLQEQWGTLWQVDEPVVFAYNPRLSESRELKRVVEFVYKVLQDEEAFVLSNVNSGASEALNNGFLRYCATLLGAEKGHGGRNVRA